MSRPGRMDVWVNFTNATRWQAEGIFKCFFPSKAAKEKKDKEAEDKLASEQSNDKSANITQKNIPGSKRKSFAYSVPLLEEDEINELAKRFAEQIPENEMSVRIESVLILAFRRLILILPFYFRLFSMESSCGMGTGRELARLSAKEQDTSARMCCRGRRLVRLLCNHRIDRRYLSD